MFDLPGMPAEVPGGAERAAAAGRAVDRRPDQPRFAKTIVNRLWKRYLGLGLFEPADDYREEFAPSHPELLAWLADDFMRHG
jgi:hypothetical protein